MTAGAVVAVVLAGGESRRFGSDKLLADLGGITLLDRVVQAFPADIEVVVVGPSRPLSRLVRFVREEPPGGGPAAGIIAGLQAATAADVVLVVPGDAPEAGRAALTLLDHQQEHSLAAVIAVDPDGRDQPLQLALRADAVRRLIAASGPQAGAGASARRLVQLLGEDLQRLPVGPAGTLDIDTTDQLTTYLGSDRETP